MLLKLFNHLELPKIHSQPCRGYVIDNEDPKKLGRVKCKIPGRWEEDSKEKLPWVYPLIASSTGGKSDLSSFTVPEVDSQLIITFPFNDEYSPFYVGYWVTEGTKSKLFEEDYPDSYGVMDSTIQWLRVNKSKPYIEFFNSLKNLIRIDENGTFWVNVPKDIVIKIADNADIEIGGNANIEIGGKRIVNLSGDDSLKISGSYQNDISGDIAFNSGGTIDLKASSNFGLVGGTAMSLEAPAINKNSGITFGVADRGKSTVNSDIGSLGSKISELTSKVDELKALYDEIKNSVAESKELLK